jgi:PilZ domain
MPAPHFIVEIDVKRHKERRRQKRHKMDCPVTVLTPGRGRKRVIGNGWLEDISDKGARFDLDHPLEIENQICLEVHFSNPDGAVTTIRFPARVKRISNGTSHEIAVSFLRCGSFVRRKDSLRKRLTPIQITKAGNWIN